MSSAANSELERGIVLWASREGATGQGLSSTLDAVTDADGCRRENRRFLATRQRLGRNCSDCRAACSSDTPEFVDERYSGFFSV